MGTIYMSTQGATLRVSGGRYRVAKMEKVLEEIPQAAVDRVIVMGNVQITSQAIGRLLDDGVPVFYLSRLGKFRGMLQPGYPKNPLVRLAQYESALEEDFNLNIARQTISAKIKSQASVLKKWSRNGWSPHNVASRIWTKLGERASLAKGKTILRGIEARGAKIYFAAFAQALPPPYVWTGRNRQPPLDPVNALLSLTYMTALGEVVAACHGSGLDPTIGFLHDLDYSRPSLALDLLEPLRASHCDHFCMKILQEEMLTPGDFVTGKELGCRLTQEGLKKYLMCYENTDQSGKSPAGKIRTAARHLTAGLAASIKERRHVSGEAKGND